MRNNLLMLARDIIPSKEQTKNWRKSQSWYKGGKSNNPIGWYEY